MREQGFIDRRRILRADHARSIAVQIDRADQRRRAPYVSAFIRQKWRNPPEHVPGPKEQEAQCPAFPKRLDPRRDPLEGVEHAGIRRPGHQFVPLSAVGREPRRIRDFFHAYRCSLPGACRGRVVRGGWRLQPQKQRRSLPSRPRALRPRGLSEQWGSWDFTSPLKRAVSYWRPSLGGTDESPVSAPAACTFDKGLGHSG